MPARSLWNFILEDKAIRAHVQRSKHETINSAERCIILASARMSQIADLQNMREEGLIDDVEFLAEYSKKIGLLYYLLDAVSYSESIGQIKKVLQEHMKKRMIDPRQTKITEFQTQMNHADRLRYPKILSNKRVMLKHHKFIKLDSFIFGSTSVNGYPKKEK